MRKTIKQKQAENLDKVMRDGPRLRYGMNTWITAKSPCGNFVLRCGYGSFGCGSMWADAKEEDKTDPEYVDAPVEEIDSFSKRFLRLP